MIRFIVQEDDVAGEPGEIPSVHVRVWVVQATGPEGPIPAAARSDGRATEAPVTVTLLDQQHFVGEQLIFWAPKDEAGDSLPAGLYRIYTTIGPDVIFSDVLIYDGCVPGWVPDWALEVGRCEPSRRPPGGGR